MTYLTPQPHARKHSPSTQPYLLSSSPSPSQLQQLAQLIHAARAKHSEVEMLLAQEEANVRSEMWTGWDYEASVCRMRRLVKWMGKMCKIVLGGEEGHAGEGEGRADEQAKERTAELAVKQDHYTPNPSPSLCPIPSVALSVPPDLRPLRRYKSLLKLTINSLSICSSLLHSRQPSPQTASLTAQIQQFCIEFNKQYHSKQQVFDDGFYRQVREQVGAIYASVLQVYRRAKDDSSVF